MNGALEIARRIEYPQIEACSEHGLGVVKHHRGEYEQAAELFNRALAAFRAIEDRLSEAETLDYLGDLVFDMSGPQDALTQHRQALEISLEIDSPAEEGRARKGIARCLFALGDRAAAREEAQRALDVLRRFQLDVHAVRVEELLRGWEQEQEAERERERA